MADFNNSKIDLPGFSGYNMFRKMDDSPAFMRVGQPIWLLFLLGA